MYRSLRSGQPEFCLGAFSPRFRGRSRRALRGAAASRAAPGWAGGTRTLRPGAAPGSPLVPLGEAPEVLQSMSSLDPAMDLMFPGAAGGRGASRGRGRGRGRDRGRGGLSVPGLTSCFSGSYEEVDVFKKDNQEILKVSSKAF